MDRATIFLSDVLTIDHAYVNDEGLIVGGSFNASFTVNGTDVVKDLPLIEQRLKHAIEDADRGLKNDSSWECQTMAHGHLSYISLWSPTDGTTGDVGTKTLLNTIASELDNTIFINEENIVDETSIELVVRNQHTDRGKFEMVLIKGLCKYKILSSDTTVEHLAEWVKDRYISKLVDHEIDHVFVSEGLSKGATIEVRL